jgi:large subunit ribosomal protein L5e
MGFVKVVKNKAYFKRYQVKLRRRREGKTDYRARKRLITQDKNKYNTPRYRLVVRISNKDVTAQIVYALISGDRVLSSAYAHELKRFGLKVGFTNYAAAYCTGLLLGRRVLTQLGLDKKYKGAADVTGEDFQVKHNADGPRPFRAVLDVGLARTTTGARVFAVMKGAVDGGIDVPHKETRFAGYNRETKKLDAAAFRKYLFAGHVADYMRKLQKDNAERYNKQFSRFIKNGIKPEEIEGMYKKIHAAIRANPVRPKKEGAKKAPSKKYAPKQSLSLAQRKDRVRQKMASRAKLLAKVTAFYAQQAGAQ